MITLQQQELKNAPWKKKKTFKEIHYYLFLIR